MSEPLKKTDPEIIKELAKEATDLMANRAFTAALATLERQWRGELINPATDDSRVLNLRAKLQALEAIPQLLNSLMAATQFTPRGTNVR